MSKKYIPTFLRGNNGSSRDGNQDTVVAPEQPSRAFLQKEPINLSAFSRASSMPSNLPSDYHKKDAGQARLAQPATLATIAPATLASITSHTTIVKSASFASKFAEQVKNSEDPNYQKPVDLSSVDDFPALGSASSARPKNNVVVPPLKLAAIQQVVAAPTNPPPNLLPNPPTNPRLTELKTNVNKGSAPTFAEMASLWAKKKEEDDREKAETLRKKEVEEEKMREAARLMSKVPVLASINRRPIGLTDDAGEEEENAYVNPDEQSSLGGGSNYEYEEEEESFGEDDDDEGGNDDDEHDEHNPTVGWDRRHQEDLY
jgi:hypothetical protein